MRSRTTLSYETNSLAESLALLGRTADLDEVMAITRRAARKFSRADGASFILREGNDCHYADEDAISPLWKGRRFPLEKCLSGWAMIHAETLVLEDIYSDPRVLWEAYHPTFVKSLVIAPIRRESPIGAIGLYWAQRHAATAGEIEILESLADGAGRALGGIPR